jgi:hypothetical protein
LICALPAAIDCFPMSLEAVTQLPSLPVCARLAPEHVKRHPMSPANIIEKHCAKT